MRPVSPQAYQRVDDGVIIFLHVDQWIEEVPLPAASSIVRLGEQHESTFYPQWEFRILPDKTIETIVGYFSEPISLADAIEWHRGEMLKRGWIECPERGFLLLDKALLCFEKQHEDSTASISLQWWESLRETTAMIRRTTQNGWQSRTWIWMR